MDQDRNNLTRLVWGLCLCAPLVWAENLTPDVESDPADDATLTPYQQCILNIAESASNVLSVAQLRNYCSADTRGEDTFDGHSTPLQRRIALEQFSMNNPFSLLPHRPNYILPLTYTQYPNDDYIDPGEGGLQNIEVQFQLSLKVVLIDGIYRDYGNLSFAYTARSFWQAYNLQLSSPFRDTNHEPELILSLGSRLELGSFRNAGNALSINHQSNGRGGEDSRSWNRVIFQTLWENGPVAIVFRPWYRIPSPETRYPGDPLGDDNPDIQHYLGHFDVNVAYAAGKQRYSLMVRNNLEFDDNKGAVELAWSFPFNNRVRGRLNYFEGYGESLIDYDNYSRSVGLGIELSGWL